MANSKIKQIISVANPIVKKVIALKQKNKTGYFFLEGIRSFETMYENHPESIFQVFITAQFEPIFYQYQVKEVFLVTDAVMQKLTAMKTAPGIFVVCHYQFAGGKPATPGIVCYEISDPGNLGTLFRTAAALSIKNVVCIGGVDPLNQKVVQASAGTITMLKIHNMTEHDFLKSAKDSEIVSLTVHGTRKITDFKKNQNRFLVIGSEAHGLPESFIKVTTPAVIPMSGNTESLNAAVAGSIAMFQLF